MLGIREERKPISGEAAARLLGKLIRFQTGNLNDEDRRDIEAIKAREESLPQLDWSGIMPTK